MSFFECTYDQLINQVVACVDFYENREIDRTPDIYKNIERINNNQNFNRNELFLVKIEGDDQEKNDDNDGDDVDNDVIYYDDADNVQIGCSSQNVEMNYVKYKLKYLELKCTTSYLMENLKNSCDNLLPVAIFCYFTVGQ